MRNFSSAYGASKDKFGHADYFEALKIGTPSEIVSYLSENQGIMGSMNRRGSGGLYDEILTEAKRRNVGTINALSGNSPYNFGDADYKAAISSGFTDKQIKNYLDKNQDRLYSGNRPEASGGLYDRILQGIQDNPDPLDELKNKLKIMQEGFDTAQRVTLGNQTRGTQQADYRLDSASPSRLPGVGGFRRRGVGASTPFSAIGFTAPNTVQNKGLTLNV